MTKSTLKFDIDLDENNLPINISMTSSDKKALNTPLKSIMISAFDKASQDTLRVDLWTKDMMVNEMFIMHHQTLLSMANALERSTGNNKLANALRDYCAFFAQETDIIHQK